MIESVFQGKVPIRRIYLNGHVVWKPPVYLPPYLIYLDTKTLGDQELSKIHLEQGYVDHIEDPISNRFHGASAIRIESGNKFVDNAGKMYVAGGAIGADLYLVNRNVTEDYAPTAIQNIMTALHLEQIRGEYLEGPELFVEKYGTPLGTLIGSRIVDEKTYFSGEKAGLLAQGVILPHDVVLNLLYESLATGVSSSARIVEYGVLENFLINHASTGLGANGEPGDFNVLENFLIDHNATGLGANGKTGDYAVFEKFLIDHNATGLGSNGKLGDYSALEKFLIDHDATGVGANALIGDYQSLIRFILDPAINPTAGKAELGIVSGILTTIAEVDRSGESLESKRFITNREETTTSYANSYLTSFNTPMADHDVAYDVKYTADVSIPSVSAESMSFTTQSDTYTSEQQVSNVSTIEMGLNESVKPAVNTSATISVMFWLFPVQTDSDLYIPQVYDNGVITGAVQNGSELMM